MTEYTHRAIIVIMANYANNANQAAKLVDTLGGEFTFGAPLVRPSNPTKIVAYWCNWVMTKAEAKALKQRLKEKQFTDNETTEEKKPGPIVKTKKMNVFLTDNWLGGSDPDWWTPEEVLAELGLQPLEPERV